MNRKIKLKDVPLGSLVVFWCTGLIGGTLFMMALSQTRRDSMPDLNAEMLGIVRAGVIANGQEYTGVLLQVRIVNNGQPSTAWKWLCKVKLNSGLDVFSDQIIGPDVINTHQDKLFTPKQFLPEVLKETPLGNGAAKIGWIEFIFKKSLGAELQRPGVTYTLEFEDRSGKIVSATKKVETLPEL